VIAPVAGRRRRRDGDAALLLLRHPVHCRRPVVHFADAVHAPGVEQDALRRRRLACVNVRGNADIANFF